MDTVQNLSMMKKVSVDPEQLLVVVFLILFLHYFCF